MGLEAVELVMAFEETFQVSISDAEAQGLLTPGHVVDLIVAKLGLQEGSRKLSLGDQAYERLHEGLLALGLPAGGLTPDQPLEVIFSDRTTRRQDWHDLQTLLNAHNWPRLKWFGLRTDFPDSLKTIRHLAEWLAWQPHPELAPERLKSLTRGDVSYLVKGIILSQLGLPEADYDEAKRFVGELGVD